MVYDALRPVDLASLLAGLIPKRHEMPTAMLLSIGRASASMLLAYGTPAGCTRKHFRACENGIRLLRTCRTMFLTNQPPRMVRLSQMSRAMQRVVDGARRHVVAADMPLAARAPLHLVQSDRLGGVCFAANCAGHA
jgi:hypothetical protein